LISRRPCLTLGFACPRLRLLFRRLIFSAANCNAFFFSEA
jgi:hypothetical protein